MNFNEYGKAVDTTKQAYRDGAEYYRGLGYGAVVGGTEVLTEKLVGGAFSKIHGAGLLDGILPSSGLAKQGIGRYAANAVGEGLEEVAAELLSPASKAIYKGRDALSEYGEADYWKGVGKAGITGMGVSAVYGGAFDIAGGGVKNGDIGAALEEIGAIEDKLQRLDDSGNKTAEKEARADAAILANYRMIEEILKKTEDAKRAALIKRNGLSSLFSADGTLNADFVKGLDGSGEVRYNRRYYNRVMRYHEDMIDSDLNRINDDLATKYGNDTKSISVFNGELSGKGRTAASKVKQLVKIASEKSGKDIGFVITDGNVPQFRGVNVGDRIYMSADTFESGDAYRVAVEETLHFAEGSEEHNALVKLLAEDGDLKESAVEAVLGADGYGFDGEAIRDIERRVEAGAVIEGESMTAEEFRYSQKYFKFLHKNFPDEVESRGSDAHKWATLWAARQDVEVGDQALASYHGRWYLIQRFNDADSGYQVEAFVPMAEYKKIAKEIAEYGRSGKVREIQGFEGSYDRYDSINKRSYSLGGEGTSLDSDETQHGGEDPQVVRMASSEDQGRERAGRDGGGDRESGGTDRQGDPVTVTREEWLVYEEYRSEVGAHMGAELLGNEKVIDRIIRENSSLGEKILGKIIAFKEALGRIGDPEAQAQHKRLVQAEKLYLGAIEAAGKKYVNGKIVSADDEEEKENTAEGGGKYSYDSLLEKEDMEIAKLKPLSDSEASQYSSDHTAMARRAMQIARDVKNERNTEQRTYLYCNDIKENIMVSPKSFKHSAARTDSEYCQVCFSLPEILQNAIAVNELSPKEKNNGSIVLLGMAQTEDRYVYVRMVVENRTWNLENYDIVYAIRKLSIEKEDASPKAPGLRTKGGSQTSSTISIADFLHNVKDFDVVNEVFSKDVAEKLGVSRYIGTLSPDLRYSLKDSDASKRIRPLSGDELIENAMARGMGVDSRTTANPNATKTDTDAQTNVDTKTEASAVTKRPTSYTKEEARAMVDRVLEITSFEGARAKLAGGNLSDVIKRAYTLLNSAETGKRAGVALNFADYVIDHAILVDEIDPWQMEPYIETVDLLTPYLHSLNLEGLQEEIRHHYDKDTSVYGRWKKRKGERGISIENAVAELAERGYHVSHTNTADILFEMDRDYLDAVHMLRKGANSMVKEVITAEERKVLRQKIAKAVLNSFDNRDFSRATLTKIANRSLDDVERLKAENQRLVREKRKLESERDRAVANKNSAEERLKKETLQRKEAETFDQVKNRVLKAVRGITNWKKGVFESAAEANGDALKDVIGQLSRVENKGNISATGTRKAMKAISDWYARPDKHPMVKELQESKLYDEGILELMNEIGDDKKIEKNVKLSAAELANVELVVRHFKHIVENYHRVFREGKYVEAKPLAENFIRIAEENAKIKTTFGTKVMESRFYQYFGDVESIMKWHDRHNENGFFTNTFRELREGTYRMAIAQMEMRKELDAWLESKENKKFLEDINKRTVEVQGVTMTVAEAMSLYMTSKRAQAEGGILIFSQTHLTRPHDCDRM